MINPDAGNRPRPVGRIHQHYLEGTFFHYLPDHPVIGRYPIDNDTFYALGLKIPDDLCHRFSLQHGKEYGDQIQFLLLCFLDSPRHILHVDLVDRLGLGIQVHQQRDPSCLLGRESCRDGVRHKLQFLRRRFHLPLSRLADARISVQYL